MLAAWRDAGAGTRRTSPDSCPQAGWFVSLSALGAWALLVCGWSTARHMLMWPPEWGSGERREKRTQVTKPPLPGFSYTQHRP